LARYRGIVVLISKINHNQSHEVCKYKRIHFKWKVKA
jgi:hypothetical protein